MRSRWRGSERRSARTAPSPRAVEAALDADETGASGRTAGVGRRGSREPSCSRPWRGRHGERRPHQAPRDRLPDLVAPLLGALDVGARVGVGRKQRRLGRQLVEARA